MEQTERVNAVVMLLRSRPICFMSGSDYTTFLSEIILGQMLNSRSILLQVIGKANVKTNSLLNFPFIHLNY